MNSLPGRVADINVFYPEAGNFVGYLIEIHGDDRMLAFVAALRGGALPGSAALKAYGRSLEELENEWRKAIGAKPLEPLPTPATTAAPAPLPTTGPELATPAEQPAAARPDADTAGASSETGQPSSERTATPPEVVSKPPPLEGGGAGAGDHPPPGSPPGWAMLWWLIFGGSGTAALLIALLVMRRASRRRGRGGA
ncbi:MAG: hypothetical protein HY682_10440 [Chloroflexi bacterium]|nr:hypothetical protein [Chloroflexota bacterium]